MSAFVRRLLAGFTILLASCSNPQPPVGRWEGVYEDAGMTVAVRVEIADTGQVRVSAPNAIMPDKPLTPGERAELRAHLVAGLSATWPKVQPLAFDFDGKAFRKHGGVAPQLEWDGKSRRMTMIYYYSGNRASVRVPLDEVQSFGQAS